MKKKKSTLVQPVWDRFNRLNQNVSIYKSSLQVGNVNLSVVIGPYMNKQPYTERICSLGKYIIN